MIKSKKYYVAYRTETGYSADYITTWHDLSTEAGITALIRDIKTQFQHKSVIIINLIPLKG